MLCCPPETNIVNKLHVNKNKIKKKSIAYGWCWWPQQLPFTDSSLSSRLNATQFSYIIWLNPHILRGGHFWPQTSDNNVSKEQTGSLGLKSMATASSPPTSMRGGRDELEDSNPHWSLTAQTWDNRTSAQVQQLRTVVTSLLWPHTTAYTCWELALGQALCWWRTRVGGVRPPGIEAWLYCLLDVALGKFLPFHNLRNREGSSRLGAWHKASTQPVLLLLSSLLGYSILTITYGFSIIVPLADKQPRCGLHPLIRQMNTKMSGA